MKTKPEPESYLPKEYTITEIKSFTDNTKLFRVKCDMNPLPGTFFEVSIPGVGEAPIASCSHDLDHLDLLTRRVGTLTTELFKKKEGDKILIRGPYGKGFPIEKIKGKNVILVGGGTGIAPITSMIHYIEQNKKDFGKVFVYLGFRDEAHILLEPWIKRWEKEFHVHVGLSRDEESHKYEKGFVQDIMEKHKPETHNTVSLICGPEGMMDAVTVELHRLGIRSSNIYWAMERRMECSFGSCGRCQIQDLYVCTDGPIFSYDTIKPRLENEQWSNKNWKENDK